MKTRIEACIVAVYEENMNRNSKKPLTEDDAPETGYRYFYDPTVNADVELADDPFDRLDQFIEKLVDELTDRYDIEPMDAFAVLETTLANMATEGLLPEFPGDDADEDEAYTYLMSVMANAGVLERVNKTARELLGVDEPVPGSAGTEEWGDDEDESEFGTSTGGDGTED